MESWKWQTLQILGSAWEGTQHHFGHVLLVKKDHGPYSDSRRTRGLCFSVGEKSKVTLQKDSRQYCLILGNTSTTSLPVQVTLHMASLDNLCVCVGRGGLCIYLFKEINSEYSLEGLVLKLKLQHFGHLMGAVNSLEKTLMLGKIEGKRRRGWQRMRWLGSITDSWTGIWANSRRQWRTGKPDVLSPWGHKELDRT